MRVLTLSAFFAIALYLVFLVIFFVTQRSLLYYPTPLLIVNGSIDEVVPDSQGKKLYSLANDPKEYHSLTGSGHNDAFDDFVPLSLNWLKREDGRIR
jgi:fermentation-respiration switch protein FrsA (DUF1100 family)